MKGFLRKLRGVIGNGIVWAGAWAFSTLALTGVLGVIAGFSFPPWQFVPLLLARSAIIGFLSGTVFSITLGVAYRNRVLEDLRPLAIGALGAGAGVLFPLIQLVAMSAAGFSVPAIAFVLNLAIGGSLGAATSVGSLKLARFAPASLEASDEETGRMLRADASAPLLRE